MARHLSYLWKRFKKMKTYILLALMQIAILPAFAQRGGGGGHSSGGGGGHSSGGGGYSAGHGNGGGGRFNGGPSVSHSFGGRSSGRYIAPRGNGGGYGAAPIIRSNPGAHNYGNIAHGPGGYGYNRGNYGGYNRGYYGGYNRGFYGGHGFYGDRYGYGARLFAPAYYRNWAFGWGLGYWSFGLGWQTAFYLDLYNCYAAGPYYAPGYYNGYVSDFNYLLQSINNQQGDDSKMAVAKEAIDQRNVNSDQVARIMNCFETDEAKVDFAIYAYPHVTDKQNFYRVNNSFRNPESAQQLGGYLDSQYGSHSNQGNPGNQNNPGIQQNDDPVYQNSPGNQNNQGNQPTPPNPPVQPQH